ncbi:putative ribonuclease H protein [Nymphaea thermarum]|nr:putative ribonuclease H protein [Nymphaea thermarum]
MLEIQRILQWPNGDLPSEYLGLPLFLGNLTEDLCLPLLTKVEKRLAGWKARILSYAGWLCLIRYVLMTLPYYWMMAFRLPMVVLKKIQQACIKFMWNEGDGARHMQLVKWDRLCMPVEEGGVGIRRLEEANRALLASRCCQLLTYGTPWANIFKDKYLSHHSPWTLKKAPNQSWGWKGLRWGWSWIQDKVEWKIGNGEQTRFWTDRWLGQVLLYRVDANGYSLPCKEFMISIREITFGRQDSQSFPIARSLGVSIDNIRLMETEDKLVWSEDGKAIFKAGEIIKKCCTQGVKDWWREKIRASYAPTKSCWHAYIACAGRLPTLDRLQNAEIHLANRCSLCLCAEETNGHVLIKCKVAKEVWRYVTAKFGRVKFPQGEIVTEFQRCLQSQIGRIKREVWRNCIDSFFSANWPPEVIQKVKIWFKTGLHSVDTIASGRSGMTINIVRACTRHGSRIAGLSFDDNDQLGCVIIIKDRGRIHEGEMEVLEHILRFHKEYGGDYIIISPTKEWVGKIIQSLEGRRMNAVWTRCFSQVQGRISVKQGDATVDIGRLIMEHTHEPTDYFANFNV